MELFKIAPFDQILRVESLGTGSTLLNDGTKTLGQLKVLETNYHYSVIIICGEADRSSRDKFFFLSKTSQTCDVSYVAAISGAHVFLVRTLFDNKFYHLINAH